MTQSSVPFEETIARLRVNWHKRAPTHGVALMEHIAATGSMEELRFALFERDLIVYALATMLAPATKAVLADLADQDWEHDVGGGPGYIVRSREKMFTQAQLDAAVAAERERCAQLAYDNGEVTLAIKIRGGAVPPTSVDSSSWTGRTRPVLEGFNAQGQPVFGLEGACVDPTGHLEACDCAACNKRRQEGREREWGRRPANWSTSADYAPIAAAAPDNYKQIAERIKARIKPEPHPTCTCMLCVEEREKANAKEARVAKSEPTLAQGYGATGGDPFVRS